MRILYDIAVLGLGHHQERSRTGVFRVVENVAMALAREPGLSLSFCSSNYSAWCQQYLRSNQELSQKPLRASMVRGWLDQLELFLIDAGSREKPDQWTLGRVARGCAGFAMIQARKHMPVVRDVDLEDAQIYHSPFFPLPENTSRRPRLRRFLTIYDIIALRHPELFEANVPSIMEKVLASLTPADWVVCISEATRADLLDYRPDLDPSRVLVTHLAAASHFRPDLREDAWPALRRKYGIPNQPYILTLSTLEPRKNIAQVIRCFARLVAEGQIGDMRLVMVGTRGWKMESIFAELERLGDLRERVIVTGFVPDGDLAPIYSHAAMFVYPSLLEGFGLPPLEAMQCGVPVITSNTSSLPEVVGDAGIQVVPNDADALCQAMIRLFDDQEEHDRLAACSLRRAAGFSWARCAEETVAAYRAALNWR
jgi:glycosyltransferase involved in cell wall biosynthesis